MPSTSKKRLRMKITIGHDADGKPVFRWATGYTKKEVAKRADEIRRGHITAAQEAENTALFAVYAQQYYDVYRKGNIAASQRANIASAINNHILPSIGQKQMRAISSMDLQAIMNTLAGRSKTLISDVFSILTSTFHHAYGSGAIERDPSVGLVSPKPGKTEARRCLTDEESRAALQLGMTHENGLLLLMLYYLGLRRGEALGGKWEDVDFRNAEYRVERDIDFVRNGEDGLKSTASKRIVPIPDRLLAVLRARRGLPGAFILQSPTGSFIPQATYVRRWNDMRVQMLELAPSIEAEEIPVLTKKAQDEENRRAKREGRVPAAIAPVFGSILTAHYFRHNYASILYDAGVDVLVAQKLLGHADPVTTLRIYTHIKESRERIGGDIVRSAFAKLHKGIVQ